MRNGYIIQTLTSVDIQEIVKTGGEVVQTFEGVIYMKISKYHQLKSN